MKQFLAFFLYISVLSSCNRNIESDLGEVDAYVPTYGSDAMLRKVSFEAVRPIVKAGKIVLYNNLLFQVEQDEGIHVFNVANPANPQRLGFIKSAFCKELAIKDNHLFTNNLDDLVVIDISSLSGTKVVNRLQGQFPEMILQHPNETGIYFECPDPGKGVVTGWTKTRLKNPKCNR